ncbi:MAG: LysR family transcriptional regulator [Cellvibrio sp.]|uniref:LysR substrate-binding domain-containing protein n=1 Tax=Cellvibrio sp. TaxID=1965322 RepID=UPI0031A48C44
MKTTLDEMQVFVAVVDSGSITAAADSLGQTVSAISRALTRLEEKLEVTLLRRTTRRLELTEEGQVFLTQACKIINAVEDAEEQIQIRRNQPSGLLRVNAASPFMLHVLVPLVRGFRAQYPDIELELNTNDQIIDLLEHRTDIAIRIGALTDSSLHARPLMTNRLRVLASPDYLRERGEPISVDELSAHRLLGFTRPESLNAWPLRNVQGDRYVIAPSVRASSGETLRQLALAGEGIVCLADFMTQVDRQDGKLVQILVQDTVEVLQPVNAVYYRNTALSSRISCFLDYVSAHIGG